MFIGRYVLGQDTISEVDVKPDVFFYVDKELLDSGGVFVLPDIRFKLGGDELLDSAEAKIIGEEGYSIIASNQEQLLEISRYMKSCPNYIFEIRLHTDCRGSKRSSRVWSQKRAESIVFQLVQLGIDRRRLIPKGFEDNKPYNDNGVLLTCDYISSFPKREQVVLHAKNRRVELFIISKDFCVKE